MHKLETSLVNKTRQILWDFEIKMDHPLLARRPDLIVRRKEQEETNVSASWFRRSSRKRKTQETSGLTLENNPQEPRKKDGGTNHLSKN